MQCTHWFGKCECWTNGAVSCAIHGQKCTSLLWFLCGSLSDPGDHQQGGILQAGADWYFQVELMEMNLNWSRKVIWKWVVI